MRPKYAERGRKAALTNLEKIRRTIQIVRMSLKVIP